MDMEFPPDLSDILLYCSNLHKIYSIVARKPFIILADITNTGKQYDNLKSSIKLYKWGGWLGCKWHRIPTFGILDDLVQCNKSVQCPVKPGKQKFPVMFDLSEIRFLIKMLPDNKPYRIQVEIVNQEKELYSCINLWSIIRTVNDSR
uniref:MD-2-related lipid-recognition domain-containing protein n=1 Tax=Loa loa TaxID=7209 RepID=A0A1I7VBN5_LOALO